MILNLILEDFRQQQFLTGIENIGVAKSREYSFPEILPSLMGYGPDNITDQWLNMYYKYYSTFIATNTLLKQYYISSSE